LTTDLDWIGFKYKALRTGHSSSNSTPFVMFRTHSPYSPFFTSGLLSVPSADVPRRGSLPTSRSLPDVAAAFYFTLQPRRDEQEFRSFLSLDLAESQSMRSASLKCKASSSTKSPSLSSRHPFRFPYVFSLLIATTQCSFFFLSADPY